MDIFEKIFQQIWKTKKNNKFKTSYLDLEKKSLSVFASALMPDSRSLQVIESHQFVGFENQNLFLPSEISYFSHYSENRELYLNLILVAATYGSIQKNIKLSQKQYLKSKLNFLESMPEINNYLDSEFGFYKNFQQSIFDKIVKKNENNKSEIYLFWKEKYLSRDISTQSSQRLYPFLNSIKMNESIPDYIGLTVPSIPLNQLAFLSDGNFKISNKEKDLQNQIKTELEKKQSGPVENVDFSKEDVNPIMHSFEKMNTADDYKGHRRVDSGDDELREHQNALNELDLNKITRSGESVQSLFKSNHLLGGLFSNKNEVTTTQPVFLYPEWNNQKLKYIDNYCHLYEVQTIDSHKNTDYEKYVKDKFKNQLAYWKKRIQNFVNYPVWINGLKDGAEIDLDSYIHDYIAIQNKKNIKAHWYSQKNNYLQDISVFVLFDQSLSTDSWVNNQRIIDVTKESLVQMGLLFDGLIKSVTIAGTWSETRHHCSFQIYKKNDESWENFYSKTSLIEPKGYTRLGPSIRHASHLLQESQTENKILILITDGKPTDLDGYEGNYGIQDIKKACLSAEKNGQKVFALTIDQESKDYFKKMFTHYKTLKKTEQLSEEIFFMLLKFLKR